MRTAEFGCISAARIRSGHAVVKVKLRGDASKGLGELESVALRIPIQAAAIDSFMSQIKQREKLVGATAYLQMAK